MNVDTLYEAKAFIEQQAITIKELKSAIRNVLRTLGTGECDVNKCEGCKTDIMAAVRELKATEDK